MPGDGHREQLQCFVMSQYFKVHAVNPQLRLLEQVGGILRRGGVIVYPTDTCYALGCRIGDKDALERIRRVRRTTVDHEFTLVCRDLSEIANYARVDNPSYRLLKKLTPGPYTFILRASHEVPRRLQDPKRRAVGIRVPDNVIVRELLAVLGEPILSSTLILPDETLPMTEPEEISERMDKLVEAIVDGGTCGIEPTTVLDLSGGQVAIVRIGKGSVSSLQ
jgi:tRNA threonylcarbamoyl adenosine modification protein (Sua5/YciO/YrdC/YwlC family)